MSAYFALHTSSGEPTLVRTSEDQSRPSSGRRRPGGSSARAAQGKRPARQERRSWDPECYVNLLQF